jgi:maltooligosyltrehalose trehalohydrolase
MFNLEELGPAVNGNNVRFQISLPSIEKKKNFSVKVLVINKQEQFDVNVRANEYKLEPAPMAFGTENLWGDIVKTQWRSEKILLPDGIYLYRFEITGPSRDSSEQIRSLYFGDPCARETDAGVFSVVTIPSREPFNWSDDAYRVPALNDMILYELNVAEFGGTFDGIADRLPYLISLGVNAIELMPINSVEEPTEWGYMPVFYFAPEERFGKPDTLRRLVNECHRNNIAVILDMVYAHTNRMFPYQIGYERFFHLWEDATYSDTEGLHRAPNPLVCAYENFGKKNDWRMRSTREYFAAVNAFWLNEYHVDGFRYDHVNGYLDRTPIRHYGSIDWYSSENRPTFLSLQEISTATYRHSKKYARFCTQTGASRIIQIAEDLGESAYQLSPNSHSAINGNWEKRLSRIAKQMAGSTLLSPELGAELLLTDDRFDKQGYQGKKSVEATAIPACVIQYIESHDESRLMYLVQNGNTEQDSGYEYRNGLDGQPWWKLQPYAIALLTCVGVPMLWAGQEFAENTGLASGGQVRVRAYRPLHWDYFYTVATQFSGRAGETVLPLVQLYRKLGTIRRKYPALRSPRENAKIEFSNVDEKTLVYRRWLDGEVIVVALNFSDDERIVTIPFGHTGRWEDVLDASYGNSEPFSVTVTNPTDHCCMTIPSNFGRVMRLM